LACSQSDFETSCSECPLIAAISTARSRTILRVTVPMPAECSVIAPCLSGFVFIPFELWFMRHRLRAVRGFNLACSAVFACITRFGKYLRFFGVFGLTALSFVRSRTLEGNVEGLGVSAIPGFGCFIKGMFLCSQTHPFERVHYRSQARTAPMPSGRNRPCPKGIREDRCHSLSLTAPNTPAHV